MSEEMKEIKEKLRRLLKESLVFERDRRALHEAPAGAILGRNEDTEKIISQLFSHDPSEGPITLLIVGPGGIGKTTVADLVFRDPRFKCYSRVWLENARACSVPTIGKRIIDQVSGEEHLEGSNDQNQLEYITVRLHEALSGMRVLVVLDDLWCDGAQWQSLKSMLIGRRSSTQSQSQVVVIATLTWFPQGAACHPMDMRKFRVLQYHLPPLNPVICGEIIKQAGPRTEDRSAKEDVDGIVPKIDPPKRMAHATGRRTLALRPRSSVAGVKLQKYATGFEVMFCLQCHVPRGSPYTQT